MTESATTAAQLLTLVTRLHGSLTSTPPWQDFLIALRDALDAQYATIIIARSTDAPPDLLASPDSDRDHMSEYCEDLYRIDQFRHIPRGAALTLAEHLGTSGLSKSAFYNNYLRVVGVEHLLGIDVKVDGGLEARLRITRMQGRPPFSPSHHRLCEDLSVHIEQAVRTFNLLRSSASGAPFYTDRFSENGLGTLILDADMNVLDLNATAKRLLAQRDGISAVGDRLRILDKSVATSLRQMFRDVPGRARAFRSKRQSGMTDLGLVAQLFDDRSTNGIVASPRMVLFIGDPTSDFGPSEAMLRDLFGFTAAEAAVAAILATGASVEDASHRLGVAITTVRAHVRAIHDKTGISRQAELVHLIYATMPILPCNQ